MRWETFLRCAPWTWCKGHSRGASNLYAGKLKRFYRLAVFARVSLRLNLLVASWLRYYLGLPQGTRTFAPFLPASQERFVPTVLPRYLFYLYKADFGLSRRSFGRHRVVGAKLPQVSHTTPIKFTFTTTSVSLCRCCFRCFQRIA